MTLSDPYGPDRGIPIADLGYSPAERHVLTVARHYFASFAQPERQGWLAAISASLHLFGQQRGPEAAVAILAAVQTMRRSRRSTFRFNCADCAVCSARVTAHERAFMSAARAAARGQPEAARGHAAILCEGNVASAFVQALETLAVRVFADRPRGATAASRIEAPVVATGA